MSEISKDKELHYRDVLLLPRHSRLNSRRDVDLTVKLGKHKFALPIVPANMKTVMSEELAAYFASRNFFYIMHRFGTNPVEFCEAMAEKCYPTSISLGVNDESIRSVGNFIEFPPDFITVDIAHGDCDKMAKMIQHIKDCCPETYIIAGNVCTYDGARFLQGLGVDAVKVGIGPGHVCTTKLMTGFSRPQFSAVLECAKINYSKCRSCGATFKLKRDEISTCGCLSTFSTGRYVDIIADGGIEHNGDVAKALVAGATMVMAGSLLAGFDESPGKKIVHDDGRITKEYFGSASEHNKGAKEFVEGRRIEIPYRGSILDKLVEIEHSLASSVSYAGGSDLSCFKDVDWVRQ
jgi:GMP reductase